MDIIDNNNISLEHLNGSGLHLNRHEKGKLAMNLIKKVQELCRKNDNRNWEQSGRSLARPEYYIFNRECNNDRKESWIQQVLNIC